jgi:hypothetical protein
LAAAAASWRSTMTMGMTVTVKAVGGDSQDKGWKRKEKL